MFRDDDGRFITREEAEKQAAKKAKRIWEAPLTKDSWFGAGVGDASTYYSKVSVNAYHRGVSLAFGRKDGSDHLVISLEPEDARVIGEQLVKKADVADGIEVMERIKEGRR